MEKKDIRVSDAIPQRPASFDDAVKRTLARVTEQEQQKETPVRAWETDPGKKRKRGSGRSVLDIVGIVAIFVICVAAIGTVIGVRTRLNRTVQAAEIPTEQPTALVDMTNTVFVSTVDELLAAIAPDTKIILADGTYNLTEASDYGTEGKEYYVWEDRSDYWFREPEENSFVYVAAFGLFTDVSYGTKQEMKNLFGHAAYLFEAAKKVGQPIPGYSLRIEVDGEVIEDRFSYGMITNSSSIGGIKDIAGKDVELDDGLLEVTLVREPKNPLELNEILACLANVVSESAMIYACKSDHIRIQGEEELSWTLDGEYGGSFRSTEIRCEKQAVDIRVKAG